MCCPREHLLRGHNLTADIMQNTLQDKNTSDINSFFVKGINKCLILPAPTPT